jgi:hypothetical protein
MKLWKSALPVLTLLIGLGAHGKPKKPEVPAVFQNARYVYVESMDGDAFRPGLFPEDRQAIYDVEQSLRRWKRYVLTIDRNEAELIFVIRKGRLAGAQLHGGVSTGPSPQAPGQTRSSEIGVRAEVGEPDDRLRVYMLTQGQRGAIVWDRSMDGGLDTPSVLLMQQLRTAVDTAYPQTPPNQKP